ncbi:acyl carrier protein [Methanomicrobium mobile]|uniref:acyl carrier protein n=1 Tax=Methanomicrobium mobile TaxID=2205 RepID=UPI0005B2A473|nr:acyl carrier protein [Methanomicrobium mobile]
MEKILEILKTLHPEYDYEKSTNYLDDGLLDSFDIIALVTELEDNFNIDIDPIEIIPNNFESMNKIKSFVENKQH